MSMEEPPIDPSRMGWVDDPEQVELVQAQMPYQSFGETEAGQAVSFDAIPDELWGWELYKLATHGQPWPNTNQGSVGSCVSFGTANAIRFTMAAEIVEGDPEEVRQPCEEVIYGGSRVEIGGGRLRGDGSIGAWAAQWAVRYGVVARGVYGEYDLTTYSETRCRNFGSKGIPTILEDEAKKNPILEVVKITTFKDACVALASGYGIATCSNRGFRMARDAEGFCSPSGSWAHCEAFISYRKGGKRPGLFLQNSWGPNAHSGPTVKPDAPRGGFMVDADVAERMLAYGDSWAFKLFKGYPSKYKPLGA